MADDSMKETCSWLRIKIQGLSKRFGTAEQAFGRIADQRRLSRHDRARELPSGLPSFSRGGPVGSAS
jgi:hypothetical protein